ncbi:MAG: mercury methylation ferredoxin HgcB [Desulfatiglandales bacterium]
MGDMIYLKEVVTLYFDQEKCVGCGMCITVCPHEVFAKVDGHVIMAQRDACMECGACARNCPEGAVTVKAGVGCAAAVINTVLGVKGDACCCIIEPDGAEETGGARGAGLGKGSCC